MWMFPRLEEKESVLKLYTILSIGDLYKNLVDEAPFTRSIDDLCVIVTSKQLNTENADINFVVSKNIVDFVNKSSMLRSMIITTINDPNILESLKDRIQNSNEVDDEYYGSFSTYDAKTHNLPQTGYSSKLINISFYTKMINLDTIDVPYSWTEENRNFVLFEKSVFLDEKSMSKILTKIPRFHVNFDRNTGAFLLNEVVYDYDMEKQLITAIFTDGMFSVAFEEKIVEFKD